MILFHTSQLCIVSHQVQLLFTFFVFRFVYIWDTTSRRILYKLPGHAGSVNEVVFHPEEPVGEWNDSQITHCNNCWKTCETGLFFWLEEHKIAAKKFENKVHSMWKNFQKLCFSICLISIYVTVILFVVAGEFN